MTENKTDIIISKETVKRLIKDVRDIVKHPLTENGIYYSQNDSKDFNDIQKANLFFVIVTLTYFYPVVKHAKNKLDCETNARNYIIKNKNTKRLNKREVKMISTNFCYGGEEIYEIENFKN